MRYKRESIQERDAVVQRLREFLRLNCETAAEVARRISVVNKRRSEESCTLIKVLMNSFSILSRLWPLLLWLSLFTAPIAGSCQSVVELPAQEVSGRPAGEELIGPYAQPRWSARGRFSADTDVYVLPPFSLYLDLDYHGTFPRAGKPDHLFTQEIELGLPYRFQVAFEMNEERQNGQTQVPFTTIEGRWAPANWGKIPFNPTIFAEYNFGTGKQYPVQIGQNKSVDTGGGVAEGVRSASDIPNAYEFRLLLGQEIGKYIEFATNIFFDQDLSADREREVGFSTALSYAIRGEALKIGLESRYRYVTDKVAGSQAKNLFEIGPAFAFKPSPHTRLDIAPLVGATNDNPGLDLFAIFSIDFGTGEQNEVEAPIPSGGHH